MTIQIDGQLEIDQERGVIYFHSQNTGSTILRICRLPAPIPDPRIIIKHGQILRMGEAFDITHMFGCNWK